MEKVTVTFKGENREINANFELNAETGDLNYQVTVDPSFESEDDINNGGLVVYLANMFLGSLQTPAEFVSDENVEDTRTPESGMPGGCIAD